MALIQCPVCGKDVSESTTACPHRGEPVKMNQATPQIVESGTENITVTDGNRFELAVETNPKNQAVTQQLVRQGKRVVNVYTTSSQRWDWCSNFGKTM